MNKKLLIIIGIILGLALLVAGSFWYVQRYVQDDSQEVVNNKQENVEVVENKQNQETKKPEELDFEKIDTSNWKTYRNEELGFEVKYPKGWFVKKYENGKIYISYKGFRENMPEGGGAVIIEIKTINLTKFIDDYNNSDYPHSKITNQKEYVIDNVSANMLTGRTALGIDRTFIFIKKEKSYIISFHNFDKYHLAIIKTFKFINQ